MGGQQATGVKPDLAKKIIEELRVAHDEVTKMTAEPPAPEMLGGNPAGRDLLSDMNHATKSLNLWCSYQATSLIQFGKAIEDAMKAIQNADDDSAASASIIANAVDGVTAKFAELTGKDTRAGAGLPTNMPGPFGGLASVMQTLESEAQFDSGVSQ